MAYAFVGWALCAATMGIGTSVTTLQNTLIVHAIGAPIYFAIVSRVYFSKFSYTRPLQTAIIFLSFVIATDFFLVALVVNRSLDMFLSWLGTWLPFALIFTSTYLTGLYVTKHSKSKATLQQ
ncbi:MAG: hypothetical protein Q8O55_05685 [Dehalococcoidales bacterium]|nr:hypothetical protein [Dehalococcoidales bacterium]